MKLPTKLSVVLFTLGMALLGNGSAWAHGGRQHGGPRVGVFIGAPLLYPSWYYPYPPSFYYPPPLVVVPAAPPAPPPVYIEQSRETPAPPAPSSQAYWYFCNSSNTYYPYTQQCPEGWQKVLPSPQP